jgi:predicted phage terminase large subunit-like protein
VNIPARADHDPNKGQVDPLGREPGEWLKSARGRTDEQWREIEVQAGSRVFNALYQGRPSPETGDVWKRQWWRRYDTPMWSDAGDGKTWHVDVDEVLISGDLTFKDTKSSDFVVLQVWAKKGANAYLLDQVHKRLSFTETLKAFTGLVEKWPDAKAKLIEDKANGSAVIDTLKQRIPGIIPITPTETKIARANAVAPFLEAGNVLLPSKDIALFDVDGLIEEAAAFPNGTHDDQVDATSQALSRMFVRAGQGSAFLEHMRRTADATTTTRNWRETAAKLKQEATHAAGRPVRQPADAADG